MTEQSIHIEADFLRLLEEGLSKDELAEEIALLEQENAPTTPVHGKSE